MKQRFFKFAKEHFFWFSDKIRSDSVDAYSAQVAFFIIIAFIPFALFLISLLQLVNINGVSLLSSLISFFPGEVREFLNYVLLKQQEPIALLSAAALTCLWSSSKAMLALIKGLNSVFNVDETRNFVWLRIVSVGYTVIFAAVLTAVAVILVFGNTLYNSIMNYFNADAVEWLISAKSIVGFLILCVFFAFSFKIIPRKSKTKLRFCFAGGALTAAGWVLFSFFFSIFVENFANYSGMYGSLAALVILMLWLYFCMYIMFVGGQVSVWLDKSSILKDLKCLKNNFLGK